MKKIVLVGGYISTPSNVLTLDIDKAATTPVDKLIREQETKSKTHMQWRMKKALEAMLSLPVQVINLADGGDKKQKGVIGNFIDSVWNEMLIDATGQAEYTHPQFDTDEERLGFIEAIRPDLVIFFGGGGDNEPEEHDLHICKCLKIPMIAPKGWSDLGDNVFNEIAWNKKRYFGRKSVARKSSKVAQAFSLFGYLYKDNTYAPYFNPSNITLLVRSILALPAHVTHRQRIIG